MAAAARRAGFEVLTSDRIASLCAPDRHAFPGALHLADYGIKLPLPTRVSESRFEAFCDRIADVVAPRLAAP